MIASRTGLAIATALACLLAIILAFDLPPGQADTRTIEDVLATLRGARWHRRTDVAAAGELGSVVAIKSGADTVRLAIGQPLAGGEQQWIVVDDHALLVDAWVVRGVDPAPVALRVRTPLARAAEASELAIVRPSGSLAVRGSPRQLVQRGDSSLALLLAPGPVDELERALIALTVVELPRAPSQPQQISQLTQIRLDGKLAVAMAGGCPGQPARLVIGGPAGIGCVERAAWAAIEHAVAALEAPLEDLVERRPVPVEPTRIRLADRSVLDLAKRPRLDGVDADLTRVAELLAVLATPAEPVALPPTAPIGQLEISARGGFAVAIDLYPDHLLARHGEPIGLRVGEGAAAILAAAGATFRDPTLWNEEPTTISALAIDGTTYTRGAVLGEWTRSGPGRDDATTIEQLVRLLASPRGLPPRTAVGVARRQVTLTVTPPSGPPSTHTLALDPRCAGSAGQRTVAVAPEICQLIERLRQ
ncbi:MAG: hypothetical protein H6Q90_4024 [Deltaproteobacteria bacterium]|nr:hypothetical protein [Deltaproteobacteria bacterium]